MARTIHLDDVLFDRAEGSAGDPAVMGRLLGEVTAEDLTAAMAAVPQADSPRNGALTTATPFRLEEVSLQDDDDDEEDA